MNQVVLVRHAETDWNVEGRIQGQSDPPLNSLGRAQVECLANRLREERIDSIFSSTLTRARATAEAIRKAHRGPSTVVMVDLQEFGFGQWEGCTSSDILERWSHLHPGWFRRRDLRVVPGGEILGVFQARVGRAMNTILDTAEPGQTIVIVSHIWWIAVALKTALSRDPNFGGKLRRTDNASMTTLEVRDNVWRPGSVSLVAWNDTQHLAVGCVT